MMFGVFSFYFSTLGLKKYNLQKTEFQNSVKDLIWMVVYQI